MRDMAEGAGALRAMVSGSGPTLALLVKDAEHAEEVMAQLGDEVGVATIPVTATSSRSILRSLAGSSRLHQIPSSLARRFLVLGMLLPLPCEFISTAYPWPASG